MCVAQDIHYVHYKDGLSYRLSRYGFGRSFSLGRSQLYREMYDNGYIVSACGRCSECLKRRRNSVSYCLENEFKRSRSCTFVTFTYSEDCLPISRRFLSINPDTGEIENYGVCETLSSDDCPVHVRDAIKSKYIRSYRGAVRKPRFYNEDLPDLGFLGYPDNYVGRYVYTPSLRRSDISNFIKVVRESYYQRFKKRLSFKMYTIGEYGPKTSRPHYHMVLYNIDANDFYKYFKPYWKYGTINVKSVPKLYRGKSGFVHLGRYLGKYLSKGVLECPSVISRFAEKPRVISSLNVGNDPSIFLSDWLHMYDMVGRYDPNTLVKENGIELNSGELQVMASEYACRIRYFVDGYKFSLPRVVINKVRRYRVGKSDYHVKSVFKKLSEITQVRALRLLDKKFFEGQKRDSDGLFINDGSSFWIRQENRRMASLEVLRKDDSLTFARSFC